MNRPTLGTRVDARAVRIPSEGAMLDGELSVPPGATGVVLFAHGSGGAWSRHSPRNKYVAQVIRDAGIGTLLFDLLTPEAEAVDLRTAHLRFDIDLLAGRLVDATRWIAGEPDTRHLRVGYFGASTGAAAALVAAAELGSGRGRGAAARMGAPGVADRTAHDAPL
jgi:putative phosphoribosyl transferase